jgi:hypothetical protein
MPIPCTLHAVRCTLYAQSKQLVLFNQVSKREESPFRASKSGFLRLHLTFYRLHLLLYVTILLIWLRLGAPCSGEALRRDEPS